MFVGTLMALLPRQLTADGGQLTVNETLEDFEL
jgi:hypothetical protein